MCQVSSKAQIHGTYAAASFTNSFIYSFIVYYLFAYSDIYVLMHIHVHLPFITSFLFSFLHSLYYYNQFHVFVFIPPTHSPKTLTTPVSTVSSNRIDMSAIDFL